MPLTIHVLLLGFNGDATQSIIVHTKQLDHLLTQSLSTYTMHDMNIQYHLSYDIRHVRSISVSSMEGELSERMTYVESKDGYRIYNVALDSMEALIDQMYFDEMMGGALHTDVSQMPYTIILFNPDKQRMTPHDAKKNPLYLYRYTSGHNPHPITHYISKLKYLFVDLSAGPSTYGNSDGGNIVSLGSLPIVPFHYAAFDEKGNAKPTSHTRTHYSLCSAPPVQCSCRGV